MKYYKCNKCGNIVSMIEDSGVVPVCCGEDMMILDSLAQDDAHTIMIDEKETFLDVKRIRVCIGKYNLHPMDINHYIKFIGLITDKGVHTYFFDPGNNPCAKFFIRKSENILTVYAFCNIHGMYKLDF